VWVNTAYFIHSSLIIKIMFGLFFLNWFTSDERHVLLYVWTVKVHKFLQSLTRLYGSIVQPFCCSGTIHKCLRCSWNLMQWSNCLYCHNHIELWLRISSQAISVVSEESQAATHGTLELHGTPVESTAPGQWW